VTGGLHLAAGDAPATTRQRFAGAALVLTQQAADRAVAVLAVALAAASALTVISTRCGSTGNGCARCGCSRCSRSSTGS